MGCTCKQNQALEPKWWDTRHTLSGRGYIRGGHNRHIGRVYSPGHIRQAFDKHIRWPYSASIFATNTVRPFFQPAWICLPLSQLTFELQQFICNVFLFSKFFWSASATCVCVAGVHLSPLESSDLTAHNHTLCITVRCVCLRYHGNTPVCYPCVTRPFSAHAACVTACWAAERARRRGGRTAAWWSKCSVVVLR